MKKINSIGYGGKILSAAMIFTLVIPGAMRLVMLVYETAMLAICSRISLGIGLIITFSFVVLLMIEFHQDKKCGICGILFVDKGEQNEKSK